GGDHDPAGLRLPPGVDDGAAVAAYDAAVPDPRLGVDGLAHGAYEAQAREVVALRVLRAELDEGADGRGGRVEDGDVVAGDHLPQPVRAGVDGVALVHHLRGAQGHGAVDDVAVAGHPADVGRA